MKNQICLVPELKGLGGPVSFQAKLIEGFNEKQISWTYDINHPDNRAILLNGGTRHIGPLWHAKTRGIRIVQRLDGMNWMHKVQKTPVKAYLKSAYNNRVLAFTRRFLSNRIIYQSEFSHQWWNQEYGSRRIPFRVVHNGIDLNTYNPQGTETPPSDHFRILLVEGHLSGANAQGLETAIKLANAVKTISSTAIELMIVGDVNDAVKAEMHTLAPNLWITWRGIVPRTAIPGIDRSSHVLFSADLNAACPNSVIEAMACGCPVVAFDTGALSELVCDGAGEIVPYGGDYWQLEDPAIQPIAEACILILKNNTTYRQAARKRAKLGFALDKMVDAYLEELL